MILDDPEASSAAVQVGLVLAASGLALGPLAGSLIAWFADERPRFFARWGFSHAALVLAAGLVAMFGVSLALGAVGGEDGPGTLARLIASMGVMGVVAGASIVVARRVSPEGLGALGFPRDAEFPLWRGLLGGLLGYACVIPAVAGLEPVAAALLERLGVDPPSDDLVQSVLAMSGGSLAGAVVICVVVGPLLEEVVFRGFLQPLMIQNFSEKGGIAITAALFALLHGVHAFAPLFALALLLGVLKVRTQRLAGPILVHALHNGLVLYLTFRFHGS